MTRRLPTRLVPLPPRPPPTTTPTPAMATTTPRTPPRVGLSSPSTEPRIIPRTGTEAKMRAVSKAVVMLTPRVTATLFAPTPSTPTPAMASRPLLPGSSPGSRARTKARATSPARVNLAATNGSGGTSPTVYFTATKLEPRKRTARSSEASVTTAALSLKPLTTSDSTPGSPQAHAYPPVSTKSGGQRPRPPQLRRQPHRTQQPLPPRIQNAAEQPWPLPSRVHLSQPAPHVRHCAVQERRAPEGGAVAARPRRA